MDQPLLFVTKLIDVSKYNVESTEQYRVESPLDAQLAKSQNQRCSDSAGNGFPETNGRAASAGVPLGCHDCPFFELGVDYQGGSLCGN